MNLQQRVQSSTSDYMAVLCTLVALEYIYIYIYIVCYGLDSMILLTDRFLKLSIRTILNVNYFLSSER